VNRVLHREHVASEHFPPEQQIIALTEYLRPPPVLHAHTAHLRFLTRFLFHAYTTFRNLFAPFLVHPYTPYSGRPTHIAVYQHRTLFFVTETSYGTSKKLRKCARIFKSYRKSPILSLYLFLILTVVIISLRKTKKFPRLLGHVYPGPRNRCSSERNELA
jgi:hypothetical protein